MSSSSPLLLSVAFVLLVGPGSYWLLWRRRFGARAVSWDRPRLRGRVVGPGERRAVVCTGEATDKKSSFELQVAGPPRPERVLVERAGRFCTVRGGVALIRGRMILGVVRVGDWVTVDGVVTRVAVDEGLYRESGVRLAVAPLRIARGRWPELRGLVVVAASLAALFCAVALHGAKDPPSTLRGAGGVGAGARCSWLDVGDEERFARQITLDATQLPGPEAAIRVTYGNPGTRPLTLDVPLDGFAAPDLLEPLLRIEVVDDQGRRLEHRSFHACGGVYGYRKVEQVTLAPRALVSRKVSMPYLYFPPWALLPPDEAIFPLSSSEIFRPLPPPETRFRLRLLYDSRRLRGSWRHDLTSGSRRCARVIRGASAPITFVVPKSVLPDPRRWWRCASYDACPVEEPVAARKLLLEPRLPPPGRATARGQLRRAGHEGCSRPSQRHSCRDGEGHRL